MDKATSTSRLHIFAMTKVLLSSLMIGGCVADAYAPRAIEYNVDANTARSSLSLLNVIRAAYRKPLQFTEVTSVTGTASASGTLGATVPVVGAGSLLSPTGTISGGPSFSVSSLSTQEFYEASVAPITPQTIALLLNQGFRPEIVFPLIMSEMTLNDGKRIIRFRFDVDNSKQFLSSYYTVLGLVRGGLTATTVNSKKQIGPDLNSQEARQASLALLRAQDRSKEPDLAETKKDRFSLQDNKSDYVICFDRSRASDVEELYSKDSNIFQSSIDAKKRIDIVFDKSVATQGIQLSSSYRCGLGSVATTKSLPTAEKKGVSLSYTPRSLQGIYEYLGSITRIELGLDGPAEPIAIPGTEGLFTFFGVRTGAPSPIDTSAHFGGTTFYVSSDPTGSDASDEVLSVLATLQALNSKATTLPAPVTTSILVR